MSEDLYSEHTQQKMHAYVDGEMSSEEVRDFEQQLSRDTSMQKKVEALRQQKMLLLSAYDDVLDTEVPDKLISAASVSARPDYLSMAASLLLGIIVGWWLNSLQSASVIEQHLLAKVNMAYRVYALDAQHPVEVTSEHREELYQWLSSRLNMEIPQLSLQEQGFSLLGGRLMMGSKEPAALFVYEDQQNRRLTLYFRRDLPVSDQQEIFSSDADVNMFAMQRNNLGIAISGNVSASELKVISQKVKTLLV